MAVTEHDREYMRRIGAYKALSHAEALAEHLAASLPERLSRSWALYLRHRDQIDASAREDDPSPFYARARALGMCRP